MALSRFGKQYEEKLAAASERAEMEARMARTLTPAAYVTDVAKSIELEERVAQKLGQSLNKALGMTGTRVGVKIERDFQEERFLLHAWRVSIHTPRDSRFYITDATVNAHTASVPLFDAWMRSIASALRMRFWPTSSAGTDEWLSMVSLAKGEPGYDERVREAEANLAKDGVLSVEIEETLDEAAAIDSIRRTLNGA